MFCRNCGKELEDDWVRCPYCGSNILNYTKSESNMQKKEEASGKNYFQKDTITQEQPPPNIPDKIQYWSFGKYVLLSFITLGIYGIYTFYKLVEDLNKICEGDGKESPNYIIVLLLTVMTCGIYGFYWWYVQGERLQRAALRYGVRLREKGSTLLLWLIPGNIVMLGFGTFIVTYIIFDNMNAVAKRYNGDISEEELQKTEELHPNLVQNIWAVYGILLVVGILTIAAAVNSFKGVDEKSEEVLVDTVNDSIEDISNYDDSLDDTYIQENDPTESTEVISGFITNIDENGLVIEDSYQGESRWITIDSYNFSYDDYHQCSNRNDLEDLENASIGDYVFAVRLLDKTQNTIALCFEILSYADEDSYLDSSVPEPTYFDEFTNDPGFGYDGFWEDSWSKRASMEITSEMDENYVRIFFITIRWANSASETNVWNFIGRPESGGIQYTGEKLLYHDNTYDVLYSDCTGYIRPIDGMGSLMWHDDKENAGANCVFVRQ